LRGLSKGRALDELRARIESIEKRPAFAPSLAEAGGRAGADGWRQLVAAPAGLLQEVFADEVRSSGAALGFTLGMARGLLTPARRAILHLGLAAEAQELGRPYAMGLGAFGVDPEALVVAAVGSVAELLWAMEEAIACRAVAAVIADLAGHPRALDFTASRRLGLRAEAAGTSAFVIRYGRQREASAARLRWHVSPAPSAPPRFDARAPGPPRFAITLEKGRLGTGRETAEGVRLMLDWMENGFALVEHGGSNPALPGRGTALPGALPAALGHRLSQAG
jgi:protein ImuA